MSPHIPVILLCLILYLGLGQGVYILYRKARKAHRDHGLFLAAWPVALLVLVFVESSLEW